MVSAKMTLLKCEDEKTKILSEPFVWDDTFLEEHVQPHQALKVSETLIVQSLVEWQTREGAERSVDRQNPLGWLNHV